MAISNYLKRKPSIFQPYTHVTVTSDEEEANKSQAAKFNTSLATKLEGLQDDVSNQPVPLPEESKIDNLDKKLQEQQVRQD